MEAARFLRTFQRRVAEVSRERAVKPGSASQFCFGRFPWMNHPCLVAPPVQCNMSP